METIIASVVAALLGLFFLYLLYRTWAASKEKKGYDRGYEAAKVELNDSVEALKLDRQKFNEKIGSEYSALDKEKEAFRRQKQASEDALYQKDQELSLKWSKSLQEVQNSRQRQEQVLAAKEIELEHLREKLFREVDEYRKSQDAQVEAAWLEHQDLLENYKKESFKEIEYIRISSEQEIKQSREQHQKDIERVSNAEAYFLEQRSVIEEIIKEPLRSIPYISQMISDCIYNYDMLIIQELLSKKRPAVKAADTVREYAHAKRELNSQLLLYKYRLSVLEEFFPWITEYYELTMKDLTNTLSPPEVAAEGEDPVKGYVSDEEWHHLSSDERNQLALDRYLASHKKTKWEIGRDYELYVGYLFTCKGYHVEYTGSLFRFDDLGRDLVARKDKRIWIVQCKYWSRDKEIHEKHIFQLFGTSICYQIDHPEYQVSCVLVTNTVCSETARSFAHKMNVSLREDVDLGDFPRIKCNISSDGQKIYHLPMDQQYDNVVIDKDGEFFAMTVQDAVNQGFRRAFRWHGA